MSFKAIAEVMQFKSERIAKNQKYKYLQILNDSDRTVINRFETTKIPLKAYK